LWREALRSVPGPKPPDRRGPAPTYGKGRIELAKRAGAASVSMVDLNPTRLETARELGCTATVTSADELDRPRGWDIVVDCTGVVAAIEDGLGRVAPGGTFQQFGVANEDATASFSPYRIYNKEIRIVGSMAVLHSFERAAELFAEGALRPDLPWRLASTAMVAALVPTLLWRRSRPLWMLLVAFGVMGSASLWAGAPFPQMYAMAFLLLLPYALLRWGSGREALAGVTLLLASLGLSTALAATTLGDAVGQLAVLLCVLTLGWAMRARAKARARDVERVKLMERERLARELHDTVAHHVSAITIRAQAGLAVSEARPEAAREALRVIEAEAARTLTEMRTLVRALRRDRDVDSDLGGHLTDLEALAHQTGAGPPVEVRLLGVPRDVPAGVDAAVHRIAQEAVTNARRHARNATRIEVRVSMDDTAVHLRVSDDGDLAPGPAAQVPGYGLLGMRERAEMLGGAFAAGPAAQRGWIVTAQLPRRTGGSA
jgi:signal transduction histidine kinase